MNGESSGIPEVGRRGTWQNSLNPDAFVIGGGVAKIEWLMGAGIGLSLQSLAMLVLYTADDQRARRYVEKLSTIQIGPATAGTGVTLGLAGRF